MGRLIFFLLLAIAAVLIWRKLSGSGRSRQSDARPELNAENMVSCLHCGVNVPASEAVRDGDRTYCCQEHRRQAGGD